MTYEVMKMVTVEPDVWDSSWDWIQSCISPEALAFTKAFINDFLNSRLVMLA